MWWFYHFSFHLHELYVGSTYYIINASSAEARDILIILCPFLRYSDRLNLEPLRLIKDSSPEIRLFAVPSWDLEKCTQGWAKCNRYWICADYSKVPSRGWSESSRAGSRAWRNYGWHVWWRGFRVDMMLEEKDFEHDTGADVKPVHLFKRRQYVVSGIEIFY